MVEKVQHRLVALLSADVVGYTRLMHRDEEGTLSRLHALSNELIDPKIAEYGGRIVKLMGDGWLVEFPSVVDAVRCATEIQRGTALRDPDMQKDERIVLRIGVNLGDVIVEDDDIYGDGVNVATRMQEIAAPGDVSVSGIVYDSVRDKLAPAFEDLGPQNVKNIAEPVRAYRVILDPETIAPRKVAIGTTARQVQTASQIDESGRISAILSSTQRRGNWRVARDLHVVVFMGSSDLDFREADFGPGVTEVKTTNIMGSLSIIVPDHVTVECSGVGVLGQFDQSASRRGTRNRDQPVLRISGIAILGNTAIR